MTPRLLNTAQVAEITGWAPYTVRQKARRGVIPSVRIDGRIYFRATEVEKWFAALSSAQ